MDYARGKGDYNLSSFEECYAKYGKEWNNNEYQKDVDGIWKERTTYNPKSKWDWWAIVTNEKKADDNELITIVDCHI